MRKQIKLLLAASGLLFSTGLAACNITPKVPADEKTVTGVSLNKDTLVLAVGQTESLFATVEPSTAENQSVTWSSANDEIATVSSRGEVRGIADGSTTITVSTVDGGYNATCTVYVNESDVAVSGVSLSTESATLYVGKSLTLNPTIEPVNATNQAVTWDSSDKSVATVSEKGVVEGLSDGTSEITVTTVDGGFSASCLLTVEEEPEDDGYVPDPTDENIYIIDSDRLSGLTPNSDGEYEISIKKNYKQIYVDAEDAVIVLSLEGVTLENSENSPIYVKTCDSLDISAKKNTVNYIKDTRSTYKVDDPLQGKGAIYVADGDLTLKGKGQLDITAGYLNGIHGKDDVKVKNLTLNITAVGHGIRGNDSVKISSGSVSISCGGDGLHTSNSDVSSKGNQRGNVTIEGGSLTINSWGDAIRAAYNAVIEEGDETPSVTLATNQYSTYDGEVIAPSETSLYLNVNSSTYSNGNYTYAAYINGEWYKASYKGELNSNPQRRPGDGGQGGPQTYYVYEIEKPVSATSFTLYRFSGSNVTTFSTSNYNAVSDAKAFNSAYDMIQISVSGGRISFSSWSNYQSSHNGADISAKGIKAENEVIISTGTISINAYDDAIHANADGTLENGSTPLGNITISGGNLTLKAADDAVHADYTLTISGGSVNVESSYEGLEANLIKISGGETYVLATDDGVNATKGKASTPNITVSGGLLDVTVPTSGDTDGIDSNGTYTQTGGVVIVKGPGTAGSQAHGAAALDTDSTVKITSGTLIVFGGIEQTPSSSVTKTLCTSSTVSSGSHTVSFSTESYTTTLKYSTKGCIVYSSLGTATLA